MALVDTIGGDSSNSYVTSIDEAEEFIGAVVGTYDDLKASWSDLTDGQKEYYLILAAMLMQQLPWKGERVYKNQRLACPRYFTEQFQTAASDITGTYYSIEYEEPTPPTTVPDEVKQVQSFIAYSLPDSAAFMPIASGGAAPAGSDISSFSLGGLLSVSFQGSPKSSGNIITEMLRSPNFPIYVLLSPYLASARAWSVRSTYERALAESAKPEVGG